MKQRERAMSKYEIRIAYELYPRSYMVRTVSSPESIQPEERLKHLKEFIYDNLGAIAQDLLKREIIQVEEIT